MHTHKTYSQACYINIEEEEKEERKGSAYIKDQNYNKACLLSFCSLD